LFHKKTLESKQTKVGSPKMYAPLDES